MIRHARKVVKLHEGAETGSRFNDDQLVLMRVESMFYEVEFIHEPLRTVEGALLDAAKADYWYNREKEWGLEDEDDVENDPCS